MKRLPNNSAFLFKSPAAHIVALSRGADYQVILLLALLPIARIYNLNLGYTLFIILILSYPLQFRVGFGILFKDFSHL